MKATKQIVLDAAKAAREKCGFTEEFRDWMIAQAEGLDKLSPAEAFASLAAAAKVAPRKMGKGFSTECQDWLLAQSAEAKA
jgi:hypothetical protein